MARTLQISIALFGLALLVAQTTDPIIKGGDTLEITGLTEDMTVTVRTDGKITLLIVGDVKAEGLSPSQLSVKLDELFST
jgi:hypothetical protein